MFSRARLLLLAVLAAIPSPSPLAARELHWRAIDVAARLEADGSLSVAETQAMVFSGDWNGGERRFRLGLGQTVEVRRVVRIDPVSGGETELVRGDLGAVDHWDWTDGETVRWRSRLPSDPPFAATEIDYRLELVYRGILSPSGERAYVLDHDFLFAERDGVVEHFALALDLAPGWSAEETEPARFTAGPLEPGRGFVVTRHLRWSGAGEPAAAAPPRLPAALRWGALGVLAAVALERFLWWRRRDRELGRFEPLMPAEKIDRAWLEQTVFALAPEVVGAAWDRSIGGAEVAATLARLVAAGSLESHVERRGVWIFTRQVLFLKRRVPLAEIDEAARPLVEALFPSGDETDTDSLRTHYRSTGFDPVSKLRANLERRVAAVRGFAPDSGKPSWKPTAALLASGVALVVLGAFVRSGGALGVVLGVLLLVVALPGWITAATAQARVGVPVGALVVITVALVIQCALIAGFTLLPGFALLSLAGATLAACGGARAFFNLLATRESASSLARRRDLTAARDYFVRQLARATPALEDRWLPWLIAFGLAPAIDLWVGAYGGVGTAALSSGGASFGGGSSGGRGWSGGGGTFGGAGATASFASAVSTMAAGVPAPGSSGSSGGGGGGGSSGGGGGGGW
jgi:uncharacterized membrane protein YgcG